jgi:hypothetical protein
LTRKRLGLPEARREASVHPRCYRIRIGGGPGTAVCGAFEGCTTGFDGACTTLAADLDQAALRGALLRIQALDLDLIELTRRPEDAALTGDGGRVARILPGL